MPGGPCSRQQQFIEQVQRHLIRLSELAREEALIIASQNDNTWLAIDKQIEHELGEKERCLGALHEHRAEHGC